jgi:hypothetical protein
MLVAISAGTSQEPASDDDVGRENAIIVATLVRTTIVALHQANLTGNYTVLRDLAAPGFSGRLSAADLARIFAPLRAENTGLDAVVVLDPRLTSAPAIDNDGMLNIKGRFETRPAAVDFQLIFQAVNGVWRLFELSVNPIRPVAEARAADPPGAGLLGPAIMPQSLVPPTPRPRPEAQ